MASLLTQYDALDIIGNGSFGIIRKVRRKSDGLIFARKELNFDRMSERDRKQIVAEVNILKDLHHEHIVRYMDRYVDRDAGILYIMMEYCGGGDLSTVIKQAQKHNRPIPEDTIWLYFMQILQALTHCHHPNSQSRSGSSGNAEGEGGKRAQILHRDLKPDNVFLDENNIVKLGDFGLSKQLAQASFANTYVGTPYYMSPELMQERAYDSKSDIWSLGCMIYELCALKPPFHEAKTHAELSLCIKNGRIPPLPRGYSQSLTLVIKNMLNTNPAMRPSASQLLQHERLDLVHKVSETEKMLQIVKAHKATVLVKEREVAAREAALRENEAHMQNVQGIIAQKDAEIASMRAHHHAEVDTAVKKRMVEIEARLVRYEGEVNTARENRERELQEAVTKWESEMIRAHHAKEESYRNEMMTVMEERMQWVSAKEKELHEESARVNGLKEEVDAKVKMMKEGRKDKTPLEEVKNLLEPIARMTDVHHRTESIPKLTITTAFPLVETPARSTFPGSQYQLSAMKGVVFTATGEMLATPATNLFANSPKMALNFAKIFDFEDVAGGSGDEGESDTDGPLSPLVRKADAAASQKETNSSSNSSSSSGSSTATVTAPAPATRLRRPSIRASLQRSAVPSTSNAVAGASKRASSSTIAITTTAPAPAPPIKRSATMPVMFPSPPPDYDFSDEENLPSPFLRRIEKENPMLAVGASSGTVRAKAPGGSKRPSGGNMLRVVAAANVAQANAAAVAGGTRAKGAVTRPAVTSARKAGDDARKVLLRP
ncbi:kinase-like protein [Athelia psychrophila]|uniref:non-specific serine/threonine protein kinase n=1 Tax=Athelia psychrophila TaxID=1759441 RepID=A0A166S6V5_9AGAM|nr:kinase-like protein [Fibularhizoctonia sp. CBS 109695]